MTTTEHDSTAPLDWLIPTPCECCAARKRRWRRVRRWSLILFAPVLAVALTIGLILQPTPPDLSVPPGSQPFTWTADTQPYGITLSGLQNYVLSYKLMVTMKHQIKAAAASWYANTIRLQILQDRMVGIYGQRYNAPYMYAVIRLTRYAESFGMHVVLNAQTEQSTGWDQDEQQPTQATIAFWDRMTQEFGRDRRVIFDLFNEPRHCSWQQWLDGFVARDGTHYIGIQTLVNHVRYVGAHNTIWLEGLRWASTLEGVPMVHEPGGYPTLVYTFHHPGSTTQRVAPASKQIWYEIGGYLAKRGIPVVDAEFPGYIGNYHWDHASGLVPTYFKWLRRLHIGLLAWSLVPGALNSTLAYNSCTNEPQGDGCLMRNYFREQAIPRHDKYLPRYRIHHRHRTQKHFVKAA